MILGLYYILEGIKLWKFKVMVLALQNLKYLWNMLSDQRSELQIKLNERNKINDIIKALQ